jgi:fructose 1,6-bisphosphate aldolase/phosphatase
MERKKIGKVLMKVFSCMLAVAMVLSYSADVWALKTMSAKERDGGREIRNTLWQYGFDAAQLDAVHSRAAEKIAEAFVRKAVINLIGHQATLNLDEAVKDYMKASDGKDTPKSATVQRLIMAKDFLERAVDNDDFLLSVLDEVNTAIQDGVKNSLIKDVDLLAYDQFLIKVMEVARIGKREEKLKLAKKVFIEDTRWPVLLLGRSASEASLYYLGDPQSETHKAVIGHAGTWSYAGSETIKGGARSIYSTLARIEGFAKRGDEGLAAFRQLIKHEFKDWVNKGHVEEASEVLAQVNAINRQIDKDLGIAQEEHLGEIVQDSKDVYIKTYHNRNRVGNDIVTGFYIVSKKHPKILRDKGKPVTVTLIKADTGSYAGHIIPSEEQMMKVRDKMAAAAARGEILSAAIYSVGDDIQILVTHGKGNNDHEIGKIIGGALYAAGLVAKEQNLYAAGQDILKPEEVTAGNIKGAGPGDVEMTFLERKGETIIVGGSDKTGPGDLNRIPMRAIFDPFFSAFPTGKIGRRFRADILEFETGKVLPLRVETMEDFYTLIYFGGFPAFYAIKEVHLVGVLKNGKWEETDQIVYANTASRLRQIAGKYVGKDDPGLLFRAQSDFPATGIIIDTVATGSYTVEGWMMGSHHGPLFPVGLLDATIGRYDGLPLIVMLGFNVNDGVLSEPQDLLGGPSYDEVRTKRLRQAEDMRLEGYVEPHRLAKDDIEYTDAADVFTAIFEKSAVVAKEDGGTATAVQIAAGDFYALKWGNLAAIAEAFSSSINPVLSESVLRVNNKAQGNAYPVLVDFATLVSASPDGLMALQNIVAQLGNTGNIKLVLDMGKLKAEDAGAEFVKINKASQNRPGIDKNMFAAIVSGTNPEDIATQVREKVGADIYKVIGPEAYVRQFNAKGVITKEASKGEITPISKALLAAIETIPLEAAGNQVTQEDLNALADLLTVDASGNVYVSPVKETETVTATAEAYQKQLEAFDVRV